MIRSILTCFAMAAIMLTWPSLGFSVVFIDAGIDTTLAEDGLDGPDLSHNLYPENDGTLWAFDGDDGTNPFTGEAAKNHGMLWFDIPQQTLDSFGENDFAILRLHIPDITDAEPDADGDAADMHRMTVDWLSGPEGGNEVTWNNVPGGPGVVAGQNAEAVSNARFPGPTDADEGRSLQVVVTEDVSAWARGAPNYGWAFLSTGGNDAKITSFEDRTDPGPTLILASRISTPIQRTTAPNTNQGHVWKYWDVLQAGNNPYPKDGQGDNWNEVDFDDSRWPSGAAIFGNGNLRASDDTGGQAIDEAPAQDELPFGTLINSSAIGANPQIQRETDLFRTTFNVADLSHVTGIGIEILAEDGAVIYVNGVEVARTNVADARVNTGSVALSRFVAQESTYQQLLSVFGQGGLRRNPLVVGENTLAVELHQDRATSNDRGFDMEFSLLGNPGAAPTGPALQAGDADQDLDFDQLDLVKVQIASKYLTGLAATWGEGDWNGAPGGNQGSPPSGDGNFNQLDIIAAQLAAIYLTGPYAVTNQGGTAGDGQTSVVYYEATGELALDAPAGNELTSINIDSTAGIFTGDAAQNLGGSFDNDNDSNIFKATFGSSFGSISFGNVAQAGLSEDFVLGDLTVVGSLAGGGDLGAVDLIYVPVPEPSTMAMLLVAFVTLGWFSARMRPRVG